MTPTAQTTFAEPLTLVCATSDAYAMPTAVMLYSAMKNLGSDIPVEVWIIDHGMSPATKSRIIERLTRLSPHARLQLAPPPDKHLANLDSNAISPILFDRFALTRLLPSARSRAIFLDSDLIVQGNLRELWGMDFEDNAMLAVQDFHFDKVEPRMRQLEDPRAQAIRSDVPYVNCGVLVCNLRYWREHDVESRVIQDITEHTRVYGLPDQDAANFVLHNEIKLLSPDWNVQANAVERRRDGSITRERARLSLEDWHQAKIIHYAGPIKPWSTMRFRQPLAAAQLQFRRYLRESGWFGPIAYQKHVNGLRADWVLRQVQKRHRQRRI